MPIEFRKEMNQFRENNIKLKKKVKDLTEEKKYLERVQRDQGKALRVTNI